ncbi:hypothetical protein BC829DRAFT_220596 [Chytridium lagenaria]|nr:hypothetical protein BC829DRAFT_220596 [Chytridium lagenaria]
MVHIIAAIASLVILLPSVFAFEIWLGQESGHRTNNRGDIQWGHRSVANARIDTETTDCKQLQDAAWGRDTDFCEWGDWVPEQACGERGNLRDGSKVTDKYGSTWTYTTGNCGNAQGNAGCINNGAHDMPCNKFDKGCEVWWYTQSSKRYDWEVRCRW